ncbi:MAG: DUF2461 domain-containing protein [Pseudomonadota bacterium]
MAGFEGFPPEFLTFYRDLERNNNRAWFAENKPRYQAAVVAPMLAFIEAMQAPLERISPHYRAIAKANGGSLFRIYRDTRFSKDKTPYKTHAAAQFRHARGRDVHAPGFYVHFAREGLAFGGGIWRPPSSALRAIREFMVDNPAAWRKLRDARAVQQRGGLQGERLKRAPRGFDPDHAHAEDLKLKSFYVMEQADPALLVDPGLAKIVASAFRAAAPLNHFICDALELPFEA